MTQIALMVLLCVIAAHTSQGQTPNRPQSGKTDQSVWLKEGFLTGEEFRTLSQARKTSYATGLVDGVLLAPILGAPKSRVEWLENCVTGMTDDQVAAILSKFIEDNPGRWHQSANVLFYTAMRGACPRAQ